MRIGVAGKGGSGKTTIAATLARLFARAGYDVNALDGDPNPNLAAALGVEPEQLPRLQRFPSELVEERVDDKDRASLHLTRPFTEIVSEYGTVGPDGVRTLAMTGLLGAGKGCICGQHSTVRGVVAQLGALHPDDVTLLDMEASLEHLSRGTVRHVDTLLIVTEPYFRALETLGRTAPLARDLGIPNVYVVANKLRSERDEAAIAEYAAGLEVPVVATVPFDEQVIEADRRNVSLLDHAPSSPAARALAELVERLTPRAAPVASQPAQGG